MARPIKKNADYFSHDKDLRNDPKVRALRRKFGFTGYGIWVMFLEVLTDADYFEIEWNDLNKELLSGDFDIEDRNLVEVIDYCVSIKLLSKKDGNVFCPKLIERFDSLLSKRSRDLKYRNKELSTSKTKDSQVIDVVNTDSKVKESKVNKETNINMFPNGSKLPTQKPKTLNIEERKLKFKKDLLTHRSEKYDVDLLKDFFIYWSEHGETDKKMRFEREKTWGVASRLHTWWKNREKRKLEKEKL